MFLRIFLCVILPETILVSSESNYNNGLLNTVTLEKNNTPIKYPTNAIVIRKRLERKNVEDTSTPNNSNYVSKNNDGKDDRTNLSFRKVGNDQQAVVIKKILARWISLMKNKSKNQIPVLKANEQYNPSSNLLSRLATPKILSKPSSTNHEKLSYKGDNNILTSEHLVPRPWWMQSRIELPSTAIENVQLTTEPEESLLLKREKQKQTIKTKERLPMPMQPIPERWVKQYAISNMKLPNAKGINNQLTNTATENELLKAESITHPTAKSIHAVEAKKKKTQSNTATQESDLKNWNLLVLDSKPNKLFEEEHDHLEKELQKNKKQPETISPTLLESAEVDDDRTKALRKKVENWFGKLQSRRDMAYLTRKLQSVLAAISQKSHLSGSQRSHAVDKQSKWRRQLLSQYSMPEAVDYRRLLSLWRKEIRRQLKIKWNRRPLVEISPGAFKTDIYVNPPDDLAKHMQKLLALKKRQEEKNRDLNAGKENAK